MNEPYPAWSVRLAERLFYADGDRSHWEFHPWGVGFRGFHIRADTARDEVLPWVAGFLFGATVRGAVVAGFAAAVVGWLVLLGSYGLAEVRTVDSGSVLAATALGLAWFLGEQTSWYLGVRRLTRDAAPTERRLGLGRVFGPR